MKKTAFALITGYLLLLCQTLPFFSFGRTGVTPDILMMIIIFSGLSLSYFKGFMVSFFLGYCHEVLSGCNDGIYITIYLSVFLSLKLLQKYMVFNTFLHYLGLLVFSLFVKTAVFLFLSFSIYDTVSKHLLFSFWENFNYTVILCSILFVLFTFVLNKNLFLRNVLTNAPH